MKELVKAFSETNSYNHKLQILSMFPNSDKKMMEIFQTTDYMVKRVQTLERIWHYS